MIVAHEIGFITSLDDQFNMSYINNYPRVQIMLGLYALMPLYLTYIYIYTYIISYATNLYTQYIFGFLVMPSIFQIFSPSFSSSSSSFSYYYYYYFFQNKISCLPDGPYTRPTSPLKCSAKNPLFWQVQHTSATFPVIFHYGQDKWAPHTFTSTKNV